jgi:hypothetical protein
MPFVLAVVERFCLHGCAQSGVWLFSSRDGHVGFFGQDEEQKVITKLIFSFKFEVRQIG